MAILLVFVNPLTPTGGSRGIETGFSRRVKRKNAYLASLRLYVTKRGKLALAALYIDIPFFIRQPQRYNLGEGQDDTVPLPMQIFFSGA